jgi:hypothetical protein
LQHGFPTEQANCVDNNRDRDCGIGLVYRCYSSSFNVAGGCTALIKRSLVYHAYEKPFKELQTVEIWKGLDIKTLVFNQICCKRVCITI